MTDIFSKAKRSEIMSKIHQPTKLETLVHNQLLEMGIEHEMYPRIVGNPDIHIGDFYIFIDGCFWHMCPIHYRRPKSNEGFWVPHIEESNKRREEMRRRLPYRWVRIWEHDVRNREFITILKKEQLKVERK